MYSVADYGRMAADAVRMSAYRRAIAKTVRPGSIVLDVGAGTGIMTLLAIRAGAARVYAVDPNPAVWLVPEVARENGVGDKVVTYQTTSLEMAVPEKVDVVISDMRGSAPLIDQNLLSLHDIKQRWLAPNGVILPRRDRLGVVLVEAEGMGERLESAVRSFERLGFKAEATRKSIRNQLHSDAYAPFAASDALSTRATWAEIVYGDPAPPVVEGTVTLLVERSGIARGLSCFFETELCDGVAFDTAPGQAVIYNRIYLPLDEAVEVEPGDEVRATVRAGTRGERWAWDTTITRGGAVLGSQRQATFLGLPSAMNELLRGSETSTPRLGKRGERIARILAAMDGARTIREIADGLGGSVGIEGASDDLELVRSIAMSYGV